MKTRKQLKQESANAEQRAVCHFQKLQTIENILLKAEIDKIKEVICRHNKITSKINTYKYKFYTYITTKLRRMSNVRNQIIRNKYKI